ncbi:hypothetical protein M3J09_013194 [Ascochyta lentis]
MGFTYYLTHIMTKLCSYLFSHQTSFIVVWCVWCYGSVWYCTTVKCCANTTSCDINRWSDR